MLVDYLLQSFFCVQQFGSDNVVLCYQAQYRGTATTTADHGGLKCSLMPPSATASSLSCIFFSRSGELLSLVPLFTSPECILKFANRSLTFADPLCTSSQRGLWVDVSQFFLRRYAYRSRSRPSIRSGGCVLHTPIFYSKKRQSSVKQFFL